MALRCETCGADNPDTNHYCGQCGRRMERTASDTPEEFWRGVGDKHPVEPDAASADLPPEVIDFDNQIPLIASNGTDRRLHPPPGLVEQAHDHLEREAELHDQLEHGSESHFEARAKQEAERERLQESRSEYLRWDTNEDADKDANRVTEGDAKEDTREHAKETSDKQGGPALIDAAAERKVAEPIHHNFLAEGERTAGTGVSGPSFLGLTDDRAPVYDDEEPEPSSHLRRNLALGILAAVLILAAVQWRSIRDYGLAYVQNGSMQVKQPGKGASRNPPAVAADNTSRDLGLPPATAKPGAPLAVESSPNADRALPVQPAASLQQSTPVASPVPPNTQKTPAPSDPVADVPKGKPPAAVSHSAAKPRPFHTPPPSASSVSRDAPIAGVDEMKRAASASDAEARAAWLWKAVSKGNPQAPIELAKMYEQGRGVVRSCDQAEVLLRSAAAKGNAQAKINLREIRARGGCSAR